MNSMATPCPRSRAMIENSRWISGFDSAAVGSSITSTRACCDKALAISTTCWSAIDRPRTGRAGSSRTPRPSNSCWTSACMRAWSMSLKRFRGCRPM